MNSYVPVTSSTLSAISINNVLSLFKDKTTLYVTSEIVVEPVNLTKSLSLVLAQAVTANMLATKLNPNKILFVFIFNPLSLFFVCCF